MTEHLRAIESLIEDAFGDERHGPIPPSREVREMALSDDADEAPITFTLDRGAAIEVVGALAATVHALRYTCVGGQRRADELKKYLAALALGAGLVDGSESQMYESYRIWFTELAYYLRDGICAPEGDEHWNDFGGMPN